MDDSNAFKNRKIDEQLFIQGGFLLIHHNVLLSMFLQSIRQKGFTFLLFKHKQKYKRWPADSV